MFSADDTSVRVALRVRPQLPREKIDMCRICTSVTPGEPHIMLGSDKAFTYDNVFDLNAKQESIYSECVSTLIEGCFDGYNATVLAYGQTGSGKTYTMGTGFDVSIAEQEELGIVPRAVHHLFDGIEQRRLQAIKHGEAPPEFKVHAEFLELYNEDIIDLFDPSRDDKPAQAVYNRQTGKVEVPGQENKLSKIKIHEDPAGGIYVAGVTSRLVTSENDTLDALKQGALSRTTASTQMNNMSSRSHAIFTLHIKQQRVCKNQLVRRRYRQRDTDADEDTTMESGQLPEFEALSAKFHFVDLAGSERLKRTGATGDRAKEGISINCGLLALGNVISALGDKAKKATHVPYRDSKLTRLLQDSLGGNSRTLMIACIAPCDRDFMETLNTLKYANRARNIKNKVVVNQDKTSKQIAALRVEIIALQNELMEYKTGKRQVDSEGLEHVNDMFNENTMMQAENNGLRVRIKAVQETVSALTQRNAMLLSDRTIGGWINHEDGETDEMASMIQNYIMEIEELRAKLLEAEASCDALRRREEMLARSPSRTPLSPFHMPSSSVMSGSYVDVDTISMSSSADLGTNILDEAKKELRQLKSKALNVSRQSSRASNEKDRDSYEDLSDQEIMETMGDSDNDNIAEEDEDDAGDEDSTDESDVEEEGMQEDLAELTSEINIKQKLIEELETNHRKMELLRHQYEEKLSQLHTRIRDTELERDQVLSNLNMKEKEANAKNIKEEYEKKLSSMQTEVKKLQAAKKEHDRLRQQQQRTERQLKSLQNELSEMKKAKVKLMTKLKEDAKRMAGREAEKSREIAGLRKTQRQRDNQIRTLEAEKKLKEVVLRRKQEELQSLKKNIMTDKVAGRVTRNRAVARPATRMQHVFNARVAHQKWTLLEKQISTITLKKQTLFNMEQDMDRWVKQREKLGKEMEMLTQKRDAAEQRHADESITRDLSEQIDSVRANLDYVQDNISECQEQIVQLEDSKDLETGASGMSVNLSTLIENVRLEEAKYLLEHLFNAAVSKSMLAHQNESGYKELQAKIKQTEQNNAMHQQLLQYMLQERGELDVLTFLSNGELDGSGGDVSSGASSPSDSMMGVVPPLPGAQLLQVPKKDKARRKTATTEDLLYAGPRESQGSSVAPLLPVPSSYQAALEEELGEEEECSMPSKAFRESRLVTVLTSQEPSQGNRLGSRPESKTLPAAPVKDSSLMPPPKLPPPRPTSAANVRSTEPSPMLRRKISSSSQLTDPSPVMRRKNSFTLKSNSHSSSNLRGMSRQNSFNKKRNSANSINNLDSTGSTDDSPEPDSPPAQTRDQNVFSRLYSHAPSSSSRGEGVINPYTGKPPGNMPLYCTHQAEGHDKPVLSLTATETLLFSSSKDRSVKVWDMIVGREIMSFDGHPNNVIAVRYSPQTSLAFSASMYTIKVWDIRERPTKCLKTLSSSGMTTNGALATIEPNTRVVTQPSGESQINDIQLNESGTTLFSAATNTVRVWDLRKFMSIGKLSGGHQAAVMVMAMSTNDENGNVLVTGSKDHYIKVFGVPEYAAGVHTPKFSLDPPHYDGIQSLAIHGNSLFSGSRDTCIKKWDLAEKKLKFSMNQAHKDWVEALQLLPEQNCLLSGGRDGYLKVWNCDNCALVGEIRAHSSPINAIATNSSAIFTASNDQTIGVWKPRNNLSALVMDAGEDERIA